MWLIPKYFSLFLKFQISDATGYRNVHLLVHKGKTGGKNRFASFKGYGKHKTI